VGGDPAADAGRRRAGFAAWHTLEDGGSPDEPDILEILEPLFEAETDAKVRRVASLSLGPVLAARDRRTRAAMQRPAPALRGKCDFCSERDVLVTRDHDIAIPTGGATRPAMVCKACEARR
jgi:hypothetical protein